MKLNVPSGKLLIILGAVLLLSARGVITMAAREPASPSILSRASPSEPSPLPSPVPEGLEVPGGSTPSEARESEAIRLSGPALMSSSSYDDRFVSESSLQRNFPELHVSITKNAAGNLVFEITGRVQGPIRNTSTDHNSYWGPYMGFTLYGVPGTIGMKGATDDPNAVKKVRIAPEHYHLYKTSSAYDLLHYVNQTEVMTAHKNKPATGGKLIARVSGSHTGPDDKCRYQSVNIADVVSYSDNTPAPERNGSAFFDLQIRMELANLHENVTGFYVGKYCYSYYSGQTDKNDYYEISTQKHDLSEALQNAKLGKVKLTFAPGAGSGGPGTVELKPGSSYTPSEPDPPAGHRFLRWDGWTGTVPAQAQTYNAVYEEISYHITFDTAGGEELSDMRNVRYSELRMLPRVRKKGYRHTGWQLGGTG